MHDDDFPGDPTHEGVATRDIDVLLADDGQYTWDGDSDGDGDGVSWTDPLNWNRDAVPGASDTAVFADFDPGDVNVAGMAAVDEVSFETSGSFDLTGGQLLAGTITQDSGSNTISAEVDVTGLSLDVNSGRLELTNQDNDATGTASVSAGATLGATLDPTGGALGDLDVDLDDGTLEVLPGVLETINGALAYLFNGNDTDLPGDATQLATKVLSGNVWFPDQASVVNFWGGEILGLNNAGNPVDPNNFGHTYVASFAPDDGDANPGETLTVEFGHTSADDAVRIRIDLNGNATLEDVVAEGDEDP